MGTGLSWQRALAGYAVLMALLVAVHYAFPSLRAEATALIGVGGSAGMLAGVAGHRPARRAPWLLLAAANLAAALSGLGMHVASMASHPAASFPAFANGVYLLAYPLYVAGLVAFVIIRLRALRRESRE